MDVGFGNFSYFIITFKHYMNCTPSEYRKTKQIIS
jgi:AraC-like DNA-binding protein